MVKLFLKVPFTPFYFPDPKVTAHEKIWINYDLLSNEKKVN